MIRARVPHAHSSGGCGGEPRIPIRLEGQNRPGVVRYHPAMAAGQRRRRDDDTDVVAPAADAERRWSVNGGIDSVRFPPRGPNTHQLDHTRVVRRRVSATAAAARQRMRWREARPVDDRRQRRNKQDVVIGLHRPIVARMRRHRPPPPFATFAPVIQLGHHLGQQRRRRARVFVPLFE